MGQRQRERGMQDLQIYVTMMLRVEDGNNIFQFFFLYCTSPLEMSAVKKSGVEGKATPSSLLCHSRPYVALKL